MTLPSGLQREVEQRLSGLERRPVRISGAARIGGGCISPGARIETDVRTRYFLKWSEPDRALPDFFDEEARSLRALHSTGTVRVPMVHAVTPEWLLLEWLEAGKADARTWTGLGERLTDLHRVQGPRFGWDSSNYIGALPQRNEPADLWPSFWASQRLAPQWDQARRHGWFDPLDQRRFDRLNAELDELLEAGNTDGPSMLHGDLWGGNVHVMVDGQAALIDPSTYYGHREVDLAMAELFGGFDRLFFDTYATAWPLEPGYAEVRRDLYQLYYVLVHVNLFGGSYVSGARRILHRFGD